MDNEHLPHLDYTLPAQSVSNANFSQTYRPNSQQPQQTPNKKIFSQSMNLEAYRHKNNKFYNPNGFGLTNVRMRPLKEAEQRFEEAISNFCETCKIDEDLQLMRSRSDFTHSFTNFVQYATIVFNSQHPTDDSHILLPRSAVMVTARKLIIDWARFVKKFNEVTAQNTPKQSSNNDNQSLTIEAIGATGGVVPAVFPQLLKTIENLNSDLDIVLEYYYVGSMSSRISEKQIKAIDDKLEEIRKIALDQIYSANPNSKKNQNKKLVSSSNANSIGNGNTSYISSSMIGTTGFTVNTFAEKCFDVINRIQSLFLSEMPCQRSRAGKIILDKINLTVSLNAFADLVKALYNFDTVGSAARSAVIEMNNELTNTFQQLGLPFELKMVPKKINTDNNAGDTNSNDNTKSTCNNGEFDIDIGISTKVSKEDAFMYFTEINSQIGNQPPEATPTSSPKSKKVQSPNKTPSGNRSPRKITKK